MNGCGAVVMKISKILKMNESAVDFELNRSVGVKLRLSKTSCIIQFTTHKKFNKGTV